MLFSVAGLDLFVYINEYKDFFSRLFVIFAKNCNFESSCFARRVC